MKRKQPQVIWRRLEVGRGAERRRQRRLVLGMGIVTALIAAIALTTRSSSSSPADSKPPAVAPTAGHTREGAQHAAARMASAMGSEAMFSTDARHDLLRSIAEPSQQAKMIRDYDAQYVPFTQRLGLDTAGRPPADAKFVSRAMPAGTVVRSYTGSTANVAVWCSTLFGLTGKNVAEQIPIEDGWLTMTVTLRWTGTEWRMTDVQQTDGPEPGEPGADEFDTAPQL